MKDWWVLRMKTVGIWHLKNKVSANKADVDVTEFV